MQSDVHPCIPPASSPQQTLIQSVSPLHIKKCDKSDNKSALVHVMAWRLIDDKPLPEPMMTYWHMRSRPGLIFLNKLSEIPVPNGPNSATPRPHRWVNLLMATPPHAARCPSMYTSSILTPADTNSICLSLTHQIGIHLGANWCRWRPNLHAQWTHE